MRGINFKYGFIILSFSLIGACTKPDAPGIRVEYVDRPVIQVEKCIQKQDRPIRPSKLGTVPDKIEDALSMVLAKVSEFNRYSNKTELILDSCTKDK